MGIWDWIFGGGSKEEPKVGGETGEPATPPKPRDETPKADAGALPGGGVGTPDAGSGTPGAGAGPGAGTPEAGGERPDAGGAAPTSVDVEYGAGLTAQGVARVADMLNIGLAEMRAVIAVEARGYGFADSRLPLILYERHIFYRRTDGAHGDGSSLSNRRRGGYAKKLADRYAKLALAADLDQEAAYESASWGWVR